MVKKKKDTAKVSVSELFKDKVQYKIPLFQRHYVWNKTHQWEPLWNDIVHLHESPTDDRRSAHFTGAIVIQHHQTLAGDVSQYDIIDGQQRLTTFQIILCAIRDICEKEKYCDILSKVENYIRNQGEGLQENDLYKLVPSERNRVSFLALVNGSSKESGGTIFSAYSFFHDEMTEYIDSNREKLDSLFHCILNKFRFVQILIDDTDKPEKIFETLNARGKDLFEFDLLRNNLFLRAGENRDSFYEKYWKHFDTPYWDPEVEGNASSETFLQHFLMSKLGEEGVKPEFHIYERRYLDKLRAEEATIKDEFAELERYSQMYKEMTDREESSDIGKRMIFYHIFGITTLHPFVLFLTCEVGLKSQQLERVFDILESYTIRRMLCFNGKGGLKEYNKFFCRLIRSLRGKFDLDNFIERLSMEKSETNRYPTDNEIVPTLHTRFVQNPLPFPDDDTLVFPDDMLVKAALEGLWINTAGQIKLRLIRYILYRIELMRREDNYSEPLPFEDKFTTLEHVMPQAWLSTWGLPVDPQSIRYDNEMKRVLVNRTFNSEWKTYEALSADEATEPIEHVKHLYLARNNLLNSIGNLTLVTRELNAKLGKRVFSEKKEILDEYAGLRRLNNEICAKDHWDVNEIHERAETLIADFRKIWPSLGRFRGDE
ncbi:MAG: DUF262 domain-containing HNH endonuclease family protein [Candidatus Poribacteria bacterium]|nr:DUF262 domain-containing HNH endonuclease family protein [Candidatus Poribacteria bacterium]